MSFLKLVAKVIRISSFILLILLLLLVGVNVLGLALKNERQLSPWGTGFFMIISGSMEPSIPVGSLVFVTKAHAEQIKENDVLTFFALNEQDIVTHRVRKVLIEDGIYWYITRGDANNTDDEPLSYERVIGRVTFTIPEVSHLVGTFKNARYLGAAIIGVGIVLFILGLLNIKK